MLKGKKQNRRFQNKGGVHMEVETLRSRTVFSLTEEKERCNRLLSQKCDS